jgi:hypothetical protein
MHQPMPSFVLQSESNPILASQRGELVQETIAQAHDSNTGFFPFLFRYFLSYNTINPSVILFKLVVVP